MTMDSHHRLILISGGSIFMAPGESLPMSATSLNPEKLRFRPGKDFYWEVEIISYLSSEKVVTLKVTNYNVTNSEPFASQQLKHPVKKIIFELLDWKLLEPQLFFYHYQDVLVLLENKSMEEKGQTFISEPSHSNYQAVGAVAVAGRYQPSGSSATRTPVIETIDEHFSCYFNEAIFDTGCVLLTKAFKWSDEPLIISIENSEIIPEYDLVKSFFPKAFGGRKKFDVNINVELVDRKVNKIIATSAQIAQINEQLIEGVKSARVQKFMKLPSTKTDKSLFTADEFFEYPEDKSRDGNIFKQTELEILMASIGKAELRNRRQIEYLAGSKQSPDYKIRFTLKPDFGFVFMVEGETMNHFCWELLNSHATYIWSFSKAGSIAATQYLRVEREITAIRETGREHYKSTYYHLPPAPDMHFVVIRHENATSAMVDGFPGWKHRLQERLI